MTTIETDLHHNRILLAASYLKVILQLTFSSVLSISNTFLLLICALSEFYLP